MVTCEEKEVLVKQKVISKITCNICGEEINGKFYVATTGHSEWGNDSDQSIDSMDICSDRCLILKLQQYLQMKETGRYLNICEERHIKKGSIIANTTI